MLGTDGNISFAFLFYADEMIEWTTGDADGGIGGLGGDPADVGFIDDGGVNSFFIPGSNTSDILNVDTTTNVGLPGAWLFQVDGENISNPRRFNRQYLLFSCMDRTFSSYYVCINCKKYSLT